MVANALDRAGQTGCTQQQRKAIIRIQRCPRLTVDLAAIVDVDRQARQNGGGSIAKRFDKAALSISDSQDRTRCSRPLDRRRGSRVEIVHPIVIGNQRTAATSA